MRYLGSKNKLSKELVPIIQSYIKEDTIGYLEPFVGGANIIDKIKCKKRIGCDIHKELIALLNKAKNDIDSIPDVILEDEYKKVKENKDQYEDWYVGLVGFCASFGAKYFGGYARDGKGDNSGSWSRGAIKNLKKQSMNLTDIDFINCSFLDLPKEEIKGYVIYCDPPYRGTTNYKTEKFPYDDFYKWAEEMSENNIVIISEYSMPNGFIEIWTKEYKTLIDSQKCKSDKGNIRVEKLFTYNKENGYIYED